MKPKDLLSLWGTQAEICRVSGASHPTVVLWFNEKRVPEGRQYQFEIASRGKLKADKPADRRKGT
jgi:hypothetical protein